MGSDDRKFMDYEGFVEFQSTLPVWGATADPTHYMHGTTFQSTLPVWGATGPTVSRRRG